MATRARGHLEAGFYHVITKSAGPIAMFIDDDDRTWFVNVLRRTLRRHRWRCASFCLMTTHYHLLLEIPENGLQTGMQALNWRHARRFNSRHGRGGHLVGDRYYAGAIESDGHMLSAFRYIARNPIEGGLCAHPTEWTWGSYRAHAGLEAGFDFVDHGIIRSYFGGDGARATELLRAFVEE